MFLIRILCIVSFSALPLLGFGQLRIGPTGGASLIRVNFAEQEGSEFYSGRRTTSYHGGLAVNYRVTERYSLHTEWLYLYRQKDVNYQREKLYVHDQAKLHYLAIPLLYRVSFHSQIKKSHQEWYVNAGPALHYWMGGNGKLSTNEHSDYLQEGQMNYAIRFGAPQGYGSTEYIEPANRWQMALYAGGGVVFDLGFGKHMWIDARSSLGVAKSFFSNNAKGDFGLQLYHDNLQSSVVSWSVSVGYFQDIDVRTVLKKGRSTKGMSSTGKPVQSQPKPKVSKKMSKRKAKRAKTS
jgi:hypothetical protein